MKNIFTLLLLTAISVIKSQVIIGDAVGTAANKTSVLLDFAAGKNKGIIVPYVRTMSAASTANQGTILLDASTANTSRVKFSDGTNWIDMSGQDANMSSAMSNQPTAIMAPEVATSKVIISDIANVDPATVPNGALVLHSNTKAMVLPIVGLITQGSVQKVNVPNPSPGMMVYVNTAGAKRLAIYNGSKWSFWKP